MKTYIYTLATILIFTFSCNNSKTTNETLTNDIAEKSPSLKGTWERTSYYNYIDGKVIDTFKTSKENRHIKVFTDSNVMWCRFIPSDSTDWFGFGSYKIENNVLTEILDYGSKTMSPHIASDSAFVFDITLTENSFSQVRIDGEGHPMFAENYIRID